MSQTLLVTGASGQLGRRVVELLLARGAGTVIAVTRHPDKLADLRARGADVRKGDFDDPESLAAAFAGANRALLVSTDALDRPGRRVEQHRRAVEVAAKAGVGHIVYTSVVSPSATSVISVSPDHFHTEQAIVASGVGYTFLRNNLYADLLLATLPRAVATGQLIAAAGEGKTGYVTREDCARAAAAALASSFAGKRALDITGPAALSQREVAAIAAELTGKPVAYVSIPRAALEEGMIKAGLPALLAQVYGSFQEGISRGELDVASDAVRDLTGEPPLSVKDFLARHRDVLLAPPAH